MGSGANTPGRASRPIEHPGRNLQPSRGCPTREAATENLSASPLHHLMNMDQASGPRMPRIKKLVLRDPVGVPSSCCITPSERIGLCIRMRRFPVRFIRPESFVHTRSSAGFTITTSGFKFSVTQVVETVLGKAFDRRSQPILGAVPELTGNAGIQLNKRVSLQ